MGEKKLSGRKVLAVIAPRDFRDEELLEPKRILEEEGAVVTVASTSTGEATGMLGARVTPDITLDQVNVADFHGIVVVGGMGSPEHLWENERLHGVLQQFDAAGKVVSAICLSGAALGKAGVLKNRRATVWETPESRAALEVGQATYVKDPVVEDRHIITANGPEAAGDFGRRVAAALARTTAQV